MKMKPDQAMDYAPILERLLPLGEFQPPGEPIHDLVAYLTSSFGKPEAVAESSEVTRLTFGKGASGISVLVDGRTSRVVAVTPIAFGLSLKWKPCPQSRYSAAWVVGTGDATLTPGLATAAAAALAALDYHENASKAAPGLCQGLCAPPCRCKVDTQGASRPSTSVSPKVSLFGIQVLVSATVTLGGWVTASCEG